MNRIIFSLKTFSTLIYWLTAACLLAFLLFGCKAKEIDWEYQCSNRFPPKTKLIPGETVYSTDTIIEPGLIIQADPILLKVPCPPSKIITRTISRVDTLETESTGTLAKIKLLERKNIESEVKLSAELEKRAQAEETAQKSNRRLTYSILVSLVLVAFTFRKQLINLVKRIATFL